MDVSGDAQTIGANLVHACLNMANALGAWLGGVVIAAGYGYRSPALVGAGLSVAGHRVLIWSLVAQQARVSRTDSAARLRRQHVVERQVRRPVADGSRRGARSPYGRQPAASMTCREAALSTAANAVAPGDARASSNDVADVEPRRAGSSRRVPGRPGGSSSRSRTRTPGASSRSQPIGPEQQVVGAGRPRPR